MSNAIYTFHGIEIGIDTSNWSCPFSATDAETAVFNFLSTAPIDGHNVSLYIP